MFKFAFVAFFSCFLALSAGAQTLYGIIVKIPNSGLNFSNEARNSLPTGKLLENDLVFAGNGMIPINTEVLATLETSEGVFIRNLEDVFYQPRTSQTSPLRPEHSSGFLLEITQSGAVPNDEVVKVSLTLPGKQTVVAGMSSSFITGSIQNSQGVLIQGKFDSTAITAYLGYNPTPIPEPWINLTSAGVQINFPAGQQPTSYLLTLQQGQRFDTVTVRQ